MILKANKEIASLQDLAAANSVEVVSALALNQKSATLVGAGVDPYVVGAAFALDVNQTKWKNTIEEKGFNWKNVSQFGNYKSPVCIDYKINKTPSWFILDSSMKIIAKPKGKQEILRFLKNNL